MPVLIREAHEVSVPPDLWAWAEDVGHAREIESLDTRRVNDNAPPDSFVSHKLGTVGEVAAQLLLGLEPRLACWPDRYAGDVVIPGMPPIQVRTRSQYWHGLIVYRKDDGGHVYLCFTPPRDGRPYALVFRGWCWGHEAQRPEFWNATDLPRAAYLVEPTSRLRSLQSLVALIAHRRTR
jgi:hypothetical protein